VSRIDEIREREKQATPGKWHTGTAGAAHIIYGPIQGGRLASSKRSNLSDAAFIAASREDIPYLLQLLEEAREIIDTYVAADRRTGQSDDLRNQAESWLSKFDGGDK